MGIWHDPLKNTGLNNLGIRIMWWHFWAYTHHDNYLIIWKVSIFIELLCFKSLKCACMLLRLTTAIWWTTLPSKYKMINSPLRTKSQKINKNFISWNSLKFQWQSSNLTISKVNLLITSNFLCHIKLYVRTKWHSINLLWEFQPTFILGVVWCKHVFSVQA